VGYPDMHRSRWRVNALGTGLALSEGTDRPKSTPPARGSRCRPGSREEPDRWTRMSILNTARSGFFSSDRTVRGYCSDIWHVQPVRVPRNVAADTSAPHQIS
jgi:Carbohydrate phosphorylase